MRKLLAVLAFVAMPAMAGPFVLTDPLHVSVTHCGVLFDSQPKTQIQVVLEGGQKICKYDLAGITVGPHQVRMTAIVNDPIWGSLESAESLPLDFTKPGVPAVPGGLQLAP